MKHFLVGLLLASASSFTAAQEMTEMRSEFFYCTVNDGKTMEDVREQSKRYGEFSKKNGTHYTQAILLPMHAGETDYDYITWGTWPDGEAMYEEWGSFANNYDGAADEVTGGSAGTCRNSIATFFNLVARIPMDMEDRDAKRPAQFSRCTLKEGVTLDQVAAQEVKKLQLHVAQEREECSKLRVQNTAQVVELNLMRQAKAPPRVQTLLQQIARLKAQISSPESDAAYIFLIF